MKRYILYFFTIGLLTGACQEEVNSAATTAGNAVDSMQLNGSWLLDYVSGANSAIDSIYAPRRPELVFDILAGRVSGNSGCNSFTGALNRQGQKISFSGPMAMTKMFCPGNGEALFMEALKKVNQYAITDSTLALIMGDIAVMRFVRKSQ